MSWYDVNYLRKRQITIDHTKVVGGADLSSFPLLLSVTETDLATVANGGLVQNANGYDIIPVNSTETALLNFEIEQYNPVNGTITFWVNIATLSHTADTVIYLYYDNTHISTSQANPTAVWDANYVAVYHLQQNTSSANGILDSTANANHATPYSNFGTSTLGNLYTSAGQIGGAQSFNGLDDAIAAPATASLDIATNTLTLSAWLKAANSSVVGTVVQHGVPGSGGYILGVREQPDPTKIKETKFGVVDIVVGTYPADTLWHYVVEYGDGTGTYCYVDGVQSGASADTSAWKTSSTSQLILGYFISDPSGGAWFGTMDEVRISKTNRSPGWIGTEYNNQSTPATFYSIGAAQSQSGSHTQSIGVRFRQALSHLQSVGTRFRQAINHTQSTQARLRLAVSHTQSAGMRFRQATNSTKSNGTRFRQSIPGIRSSSARLRLYGNGRRSQSMRFVLASPAPSTNASAFVPTGQASVFVTPGLASGQSGR